MRTSITTYTMLALALGGCAKSTPDVVLPPECRNFQLAIEDESVNIGRHFEAAFDALRAITNSDQRAACYVRWVDELCKLDVRNLDYMRQAYCIREVLDATRSGTGLLNDCRMPDPWLEVVIDSILKGLMWGRQQLERLKPTMPTGSSYDYGKDREYSQWQYCYGTAWGRYQTSMGAIEGVSFDERFKNHYLGYFVSPTARENAKKKIEKFLGRKMHNEVEYERAYEMAKAELNAVNAREVGPDLKKLRPAGGSSK